MRAEQPGQSLWTLIAVGGLPIAVHVLADREGTPPKNIHQWSEGEADPPRIPGLAGWANCCGIRHVIWTALGPRFDGRPIAPTQDQAVAYLQELCHGGRSTKAEEYVRRAPLQIRTAYRRRLERCLGWTPRE